MGHSASPEAVEQVVRETVSRLQEGGPSEPVKEWKNVQSGQKPASTERIIITAFGKNRVGILAKMTEALAKNNCDILDLTQKLMQDFLQSCC